MVTGDTGECATRATAGEPVDYVVTVTVTGDGNSLSHRSVTALQSPLRPEPPASDPYITSGL